MNCILHIGTEKTGTTAIQHFLDENRSLFHSHGILFTKSAGATNNRGLSVAAYDLSRRDDYTKSHGLRTNEQLSKHQDRIIDDLRIEISKAEGMDTVIFSSEHIHSRLRTDSEVERLHSILKSLGFQKILVIIYLREQVESVTSLYSTAVLYGGRTTLPPAPNEEEVWNNICDHKASVLRYTRVFGHNFVKPRLFSKDSLLESSIIMDLIDTAGVSVPKEALQFPSRMNESISSLGIELFRRLNILQPKWFDDGTENPRMFGVPEIFRSVFTNGKKFSLSPELALQYRSAYSASNEWVRREYFPDRKELFTTILPDHSTSSDLPVQELDQIAATLNLLLTRSRSNDLSGKVLASLFFARIKNRLIKLVKRFTQRR